MEHEQTILDFTIRSVRELGLTIEETHAEQFVRYTAHLSEWNRAINLTAVIDPKEIIIKHFVDSLGALVAITFPHNCVVLDIGSGGGFPGLPLKIVRPDIRLILVEPIQKKCSFLHSVIGLLKLQDVAVFDGTLEDYAGRAIHQLIDVVVIRALKSGNLMKHLPALLAPKGKVVLYRTSTIDHKDKEISDKFHVFREITFMLPHGFGRRIISVIEKSPTIN